VKSLARRGQDGAVAVVVAVLLFVFVAAGALAIDVGSGWATKRDLVVDLDAAALAGARRLSEVVVAQGASACVGTPAPSTVAAVRSAVEQARIQNGGRANFGEITDDSIDCSRRTVRVVGTQPAQGTFARAISGADVLAGGYAMAKAVRGGRLLPLTVCEDIPAIRSWITEGVPADGRVVIDYDSVTCGVSSGAWGWLASNSVTVLRPWLVEGYPYELTLGSADSCPGAEADNREVSRNPDLLWWCNGGAGANAALIQNNIQTSLTDLICPSGTSADDCVQYTILLHDDARASGSNVLFRPTAFIDVVIRGANANGTNSTVTLELVAFTRATGAVSRRVPMSYLCSVDGAPSGDPTCG
jgi:hypothetical protein